MRAGNPKGILKRERFAETDPGKTCYLRAGRRAGGVNIHTSGMLIAIRRQADSAFVIAYDYTRLVGGVGGVKKKILFFLL